MADPKNIADVVVAHVTEHRLVTGLPGDYTHWATVEELTQEIDKASADAREQGRREVYAALLAITDRSGDGPFNDLSCNFCGIDRYDYSKQESPLSDRPPEDHRASCLWLRARAAMLESAAKANGEV
jgi:hypothetical protein